MQDFEKLGVFYLGRLYDLGSKTLKEDLLLYDSKDLVTHAVCVGMTGSGKTGLCISIIEEAALDGVPAILIDPKGDLCNLLLTFPGLTAEEFMPWINPEDARLKGLTPEAYAQQQADLWKKGLGSWGQDGARIEKLRNALDAKIYTPGSNAGFPVSILKSFAAPDAVIVEDRELMQERVNTTVTSLLSLVGIEADPIQSREHILLSTIIDATWRKGQDLDLAALIQQIQAPPMTKIGVLDLESFYPTKERFSLVMALNNLLASPGFNTWLEGEPLDIQQILYSPQGKPRVSIFSIAHLNDAERMFFVALLMNQVLGWMRAQPGTTSLRAIVYMDEIFGYLPPVGNPPSKLPMLTLLKQARAFGVGLILATQNPVDLDYKALSNTGTWFIGRLQTERDKMRLLDGLEGASATTGSQFDRQGMERIIAGLGSRIFLMNNTHEDAPEIFQTRWALSYLRGPMTREQIKTVMAPLKSAQVSMPGAQTPAYQTVPAATAGIIGRTGPTQAPASPATRAPALPPDIPHYFAPTRGRVPSGSALYYQPLLLGAAKVNFSDLRLKVDTSQNVIFVTPITDEVIPVDWEKAQDTPIALADLEKATQEEAFYAELAPAAAQARSYTAWSRDFVTWLYGSQKVELLRSPSTNKVSQPGEAERDFRVRLGQEARELRDDSMDKLRQKYATRIATLKERIRRAEQAVEREQGQAKQQQFQAAVSIGATLLGAFTGRKIGRSALGKATTAARGVSRAAEAKKDIDRAEDTVEAYQQQLQDLQAQFDEESKALEERIDPLTEELETVVVKPNKTDISLQVVALVWMPHWKDEQDGLTPAF